MLQNISHLIYIIISPVASTFFILLNSLTIYVFYKKFRLTTLSLIVIVNICACDIFVCLFSNTFYMANILHPLYSWSTGPLFCKLFKFLTMMANVAQIYLLCILTADRLRRLLNTRADQWRKTHGVWLVSAAWTAATVVTIPRLILFDEIPLYKSTSSSNDTLMIVDYACKPVGLTAMYTAVTVTTFILAYAIPLIFLAYVMLRSEILMWKRRKSIHMATSLNACTRMNKKLSLTFMLTSILFMVVWTPFFVLSITDITTNISRNRNVHFALRCTLLIIGSAKPIIYFICLDKFRKCFNFGIKTSQTTSFEISSQLRTTATQPSTKATALMALADEGRLPIQNSSYV